MQDLTVTSGPPARYNSSPVVGYGIAIVTTAAALVLRLLLAPVLGQGAIFLLFAPAVLISAGVGGFGPGIVATACGAVAGTILLLEPVGSFVLTRPNDYVHVGIFTAVGITISWLHAALRSARRRAESSAVALSDSEERFHLFVDAVTDYAIFMLDADGRVASWNSGAERIKGFQRDEIIGQPYRRFFPPDDVVMGRPDQILSIAAREGSYTEEAYRVRKDGSRFLANITITAIRDTRGTLRGFGKVVRDITERKQAEDAIKRSLQRLEALHTIDRAILAAHSPEHIAREALAHLRQIIPYRRASVVIMEGEHEGRRVLAEVLDRPLAEDERPELEIALRAEESVVGTLALCCASPEGFTVEHQEIINEVGSQLAIALQQARLRDALRGYALELEARVDERTAALREANADLETFTYTMAHDLRAPLRAMQGFGAALVEDYAPLLESPGDEYALAIVDAAAQMDVLIQDLLAYSRLAREDVVLQPCNLDTIVAEAIEQTNNLLVERDALVSVADPLGIVIGHRPTLVQVVANLLTNAAKFVTPGVRPEIKVWAEPDQAATSPMRALSIADNGIGIAVEHQERIFGIFERLHGSETYPGTGIGLAIVRRGIERMGGTVDIVSQPGHGSTFLIHLPTSETT